MYAIEISWFAIIVATLLAQVVGFVWYSPAVFWKKWIVLSGFNENDIHDSKSKGMAKIITISILSTFVMSYVVAHLVTLLVITTASKALMLAFWLWLGFMATNTAHDFLWSPKPKPWALYVLNNGHHFLALAVMTLTLYFLL